MATYSQKITLKNNSRGERDKLTKFLKSAMEGGHVIEMSIRWRDDGGS